MNSLRELFRIGIGPSSSHTMGPQAAAIQYLERHPEATAFDVTLYGSLAATGKGHMTDVAILRVLEPKGSVTIHWEPTVFLPYHPNGMKFAVLQPDGSLFDEWTIYSVGGGALSEGTSTTDEKEHTHLYPLTTMKKIMAWCQETGHAFWEYVEQCEGPEIWDYLREVGVSCRKP
jgi:L-serine dehydratase